MTAEFCVYGDSIAFGYGNGDLSWFDLLLKVHQISGNKLAKNGEKIADVLQKISEDSSQYSYLFVAVGINDLLQVSNDAKNFDNAELLLQYEKILTVAKSRARRLFIQSVLPVRENLFPNQVWLNSSQWAFNANIIEFNQVLKGLAQKHGALYIDAYSEFLTQSLEELYIDAVHLNNKGQTNLFEIYDNKLKDKK